MYGIDLINPMIHIIPEIGRDITPIKNKGRWCIRLEKIDDRERSGTNSMPPHPSSNHRHNREWAPDSQSGSRFSSQR
ncbi:hypothetical protein HID58_033778 [Brassica napus]|uniref:Uncharacterized protein n=1 Tax=Brassica napus TaxID=3708 RepID=A0ABQ8C075_BRANA|nr:hypothetical protein HID58_033778 [Brassica napus]